MNRPKKGLQPLPAPRAPVEQGRLWAGTSSWGCHSKPVETKGDSWQEGTVRTSMGEGRTWAGDGDARQGYKVQAGQSLTGKGLPNPLEPPLILWAALL